ncbi:hypothetical protein D1007_09585 [Hordeum vulgare]|nr:hypothetical protein D1007_09585 [Hordeum vulgare]
MEYVRSENLLPVPGLKAHDASLVVGLDSRDWFMVCEALNNVCRLSIHHPALLALIISIRLSAGADWQGEGGVGDCEGDEEPALDGLGSRGARGILGLNNPRGAKSCLGVA